jgi:hypothetical protein
MRAGLQVDGEWLLARLEGRAAMGGVSLLLAQLAGDWAGLPAGGGVVTERVAVTTGWLMGGGCDRVES